MSTKNLLDKRIKTFKKEEGTPPNNIKIGVSIFNSLIDECGQDFSSLDALASHYLGIPIELIYTNNVIASRLIILN